MCDTFTVTGNEFERRIKRLGRLRGVAVTFAPAHGKGSHGRLHFGDRFTTVKDRRKEIGPGLLKAMLDQLGLSKSDVGL
jgi:mRNA interferase HicA